MKIAHISDLHLSGGNYVPEWGENLFAIMASVSPDVLLITGDLTDKGRSYEYDKAKAFVDRFLVANKIIVPGNHDSKNMGYEIFEELFGTRFPHFENEKVAILGLDSTEPDITDGHIGRMNYGMIREKMLDKEKIKILCLHHHLISVPGTGRERNIAVDAGEILKLCKDLKVNFVLSGHKHLPWVWNLENTYYITAGTATSRRLKGRSHPSFNVMTIDHEQIVIDEINVSDKNRKEILRIPDTFARNLVG